MVQMPVAPAMTGMARVANPASEGELDGTWHCGSLGVSISSEPQHRLLGRQLHCSAARARLTSPSRATVGRDLDLGLVCSRFCMRHSARVRSQSEVELGEGVQEHRQFRFTFFRCRDMMYSISTILYYNGTLKSTLGPPRKTSPAESSKHCVPRKIYIEIRLH